MRKGGSCGWVGALSVDGVSGAVGMARCGGRAAPR